MSKDNHKIKERLEDQIHELLTDMERNPTLWSSKERLSVIQIVGGYLIRQTKFEDEYVPTGATVRKYSGAFRTSAVGKTRGVGARVALASDPDDEDAA